ncbi:hypothetical protein ACIQXV_02835 [Neobacillus sp. NPDC097160]|uniref:hypothetical protein n=1 Tax=Neobacillus sp. NPDC097160 TaxID=3364298 RepID=UPI0038306250
MYMARPNFIDSEYFYYDESGNMRLRDGAPKEVRREFKLFIKAYADWQRTNEQGFEQPPLVCLEDIIEELPLVIRIEDIE